MDIIIVAAMDKKRCIGQTNGHKGLPWHLPGDMAHFREKTRGKPIIFGRKTFEAFGAHPLPKRPNIIVTRDMSFQVKGVEVAHCLESALCLAKMHGSEEIIIGGGTQIYQQALALDVVTRMVLTEINLDVEGDAFFPEFDKDVWGEISRTAQEENGTHYDFVVYEKSE